MGTALVHPFDCLIRVDFSSYPRATRVQKDNAHQSRSGQERSKLMVLLSQRVWSYYKIMLTLALHGGKSSKSWTLEALRLNNLGAQ